MKVMENAKITQNCSETEPDAVTYFKLISTTDLVLLILAFVVTLVTVGIYVEELVLMHRHFQEWHMRKRAVWLLSIYPVVSVTSLASICIPRIFGINFLVATFYFSVCMWLFMRMPMDYYKGCKETMARHLSHTVIRLNTPPCCCCCVCLPTYSVNKSRIHLLEKLVLQYIILQPVVLYLSLAVYADKYDTIGQRYTAYWATLGSALTTVSSMVALYAFFMFFFLVREPLQHTAVTAKFFCLKTVLILVNMQRFIFDVLVSTDVITCTPALPAKQDSNRMFNLSLVFEMLLLSILARVFYKRDMVKSKSSKYDEISGQMHRAGSAFRVSVVAGNFNSTPLQEDKTNSIHSPFPNGVLVISSQPKIGENSYNQNDVDNTNEIDKLSSSNHHQYGSTA